ncbi:MAG TPA: hypothetical protein RMG48_22315 [Myxococcales bacterium LLY-WYZ-16_1]|nr:hypothetical protein [Myxococcales bacterium LLY-WYZ-16_1]
MFRWLVLVGLGLAAGWLASRYVFEDGERSSRPTPSRADRSPPKPALPPSRDPADDAPSASTEAAPADPAAPVVRGKAGRGRIERRGNDVLITNVDPDPNAARIERTDDGQIVIRNDPQ